jgi:hypothetical protein
LRRTGCHGEARSAERLTCVECGHVQQAPVARGWMAYLTIYETEPEVVVYCPECDEREFGVNLLDAGD